MEVENFVQDMVKNGFDYYMAISTAKDLFYELYKNDSEKLAEVKDAILKLRLKTDDETTICKCCENEMEDDEFELCCTRCGYLVNKHISYVSTPYGYIFEPSKPMYNPHKHFVEIFNQILGLTIPKDGAAVLNTLRQYCYQNNITIISIEIIRQILKKLKLSKYYKFTSYFYVELTYVRPPNIPSEFMMKANAMFTQYIKIREQIYKEKKWGPNNPPFPYLIYKIFDKILPLDDVENRRLFVFIKLPSKTTLNKRDQEWDVVYNQINLYVK
jgi:hypothetical protein